MLVCCDWGQALVWFFRTDPHHRPLLDGEVGDNEIYRLRERLRPRTRRPRVIHEIHHSVQVDGDVWAECVHRARPQDVNAASCKHGGRGIIGILAACSQLRF